MTLLLHNNFTKSHLTKEQKNLKALSEVVATTKLKPEIQSGVFETFPNRVRCV